MNTRKLELWILFADVAWIAGSFLAASVLRFGFTWTLDERLSIHALVPFVVAAAIVWSALSIFMPMDGFRGGWKFSTVLSHLFFGTGCVLAVILAAGYFSRTYVSRLALGCFIAIMFGGFLLVRCSTRFLLRRRHRGGEVWRVVIMGGGRVAQELAAKIEQHPEMLCKVVGLLFPQDAPQELIVPGAVKAKQQTLTTLQITNMLRRSRVNEVIFAFSETLTPEMRMLMSQIRDAGIETAIVPQPYELYASKSRLITLDDLPLVQLRDPALRRRYVVLKRCFDFLVASILLLPAAVLLTPAATVLFLKKRTAFRWDSRCGQFGKPFRMLRLNVDRPAPEYSKFERLLDQLSLTELPQLWNVLYGQMSLVGPRPDPLTRIPAYSPWHHRRLRVKPGMTGLAQVHGLREFSSAEEKTRFDLQYVVDPYLLRDVSLLLQTIWTLLLRVIPSRSARSPETNWNEILIDDVISNAHSAQPSAD